VDIDIAKLIKTDKKLTMHIARQTFGNISGEKIPIQMLQKLYRHSSITTTIGYCLVLIFTLQVFKINGSLKLNLFKEKIAKIFSLTTIDNSSWERKRDRILNRLQYSLYR
jgi:hypothetical protein